MIYVASSGSGVEMGFSIVCVHSNWEQVGVAFEERNFGQTWVATSLAEEMA